MLMWTMVNKAKASKGDTSQIIIVITKVYLVALNMMMMPLLDEIYPVRGFGIQQDSLLIHKSKLVNFLMVETTATEGTTLMLASTISKCKPTGLWQLGRL